MRSPIVLLVCTITVCGSGCFAPVLRENDPRVDFPDDIESMGADAYWIRNDVPFGMREDVRSVAITEFAVEFVTIKHIRGLPLPTAKVDVAAFTPVGAGLAVLGIGRRLAEFEDEFLREFPGELYQQFVQILKENDINVVPMKGVVESKAYAKYVTENRGTSSFLDYVNPLGSDTGRIKRTVTIPVRGLHVITGATRGDIEDVDAELLQDVGADVVLRARFRVGVHEGAASLERGSIVTVTGRNVLGFLESGRSLISDQAVLWHEGFMPLEGSTYSVHSTKYRLAMKSLFSCSMELAMRSR